MTTPTGTGGHRPIPPKEPFAYISKPGGLFNISIREPWIMAAFFFCFIVAGIVFFGMARKGVAEGADGAALTSYLILAVFVGIGAIGLVIALVRWRWKRAYVRLVGHSPWAK
ncbi:MAG: hypothetical protein ABI137_08335 [Antricoccus sp.]